LFIRQTWYDCAGFTQLILPRLMLQGLLRSLSRICKGQERSDLRNDSLQARVHASTWCLLLGELHVADHRACRVLFCSPAREL